MKKILSNFSVLLVLVISSTAQRVGIGTTSPNASAQLDVTSSNKGLLIPRVSLVSETDVVTVSNPAVSLMVYNTNGALPDSAGYYYWGGTKWLKLITNTKAGGDLTGNYPKPVVSKLNTTPLPVAIPGFFEVGKTLRFNLDGTGGWEYKNPVEYAESIAPGNVTLVRSNNGPVTLNKSDDGASLLPLCYGNYIGGNILSGQTTNVTVAKWADGVFQFHINPTSFGFNTVFDPVFSLTITSANLYGFISAYKNGPYDFVVVTRSPSQTYIDFPFSFTVYNR